jgi:DNA-binding response OmpR family regulator
MAATARAPILEARKQILYVEDHEDSRQLLTLMLGLVGYEVATASTTAEALSLARLQWFDLYILESWLPDVSGVELCRQIHAFDAETPIMFYSSAAYDKDIAAGLAAGAQRYLVKPMDIYIIKEAVAQLLMDGAEMEASIPQEQLLRETKVFI